MPRITLVGYRGTGKSTVAALLAARLGCGWIDADAVLEERLGTTIAALARDRGERAFRDAESTILRDLLASCPGVLATGGGVVLRPENRELLRGAGRPVAWLTAAAGVIRGRLAADPLTRDRRPALAGDAAAGGDPLAEVDAALADREPLYREVADVAFDTTADPPERVAERIAAWLDSDPRAGGRP
ncbi:MAG: shikimate kinase [Planctomycetaceae bacterium]